MAKLMSLLIAIVLTVNSSIFTPPESTGETTKHVVKSITIDKTANTESTVNIHEVCEIEYDERGRITKIDSIAYSGFEKYIYPDMVYSIITPGIDTYQYNSKDDISRITRTDEDGEIRFTIDYIYKDGKVISETYNNGTKKVVSTYNYREDGTLEYVERDEGIRISTLKFSFNEDGSLNHMRLKEKFSTSDLDYSSTINYQEDGNIQTVQMISGNMPDETTGINFTYDEDGDLYQVKFTQGYFKNDYCYTYEYEDIAING